MPWECCIKLKGCCEEDIVEENIFNDIDIISNIECDMLVNEGVPCKVYYNTQKKLCDGLLKLKIQNVDILKFSSLQSFMTYIINEKTLKNVFVDIEIPSNVMNESSFSHEDEVNSISSIKSYQIPFDQIISIMTKDLVGRNKVIEKWLQETDILFIDKIIILVYDDSSGADFYSLFPIQFETNRVVTVLAQVLTKIKQFNF